MYPRFILDRQLFPRNAVNSWRRSTRTRTRGDGQTDPRSPYPYGVNYRPSNRIDVKDLRRVVLPAYSVSAYLYGFLSASSARERERERKETSRFANFRLDENFLKNRLAAYPSDIGRYGRPSSSFHPIPIRSIRILPSLRPI